MYRLWVICKRLIVFKINDFENNLPVKIFKLWTNCHSRYNVITDLIFCCSCYHDVKIINFYTRLSCPNPYSNKTKNQSQERPFGHLRDTGTSKWKEKTLCPHYFDLQFHVNSLILLCYLSKYKSKFTLFVTSFITTLS